MMAGGLPSLHLLAVTSTIPPQPLDLHIDRTLLFAGMPPVKNEYDDSLGQQSFELAKR
jgi:hypothetical protein